MKKAVAVLTLLLAAGAAIDAVAQSPIVASPKEIVTIASTFLGARYRFGGTSERAFDCSGFVRHSFHRVGIELPRTSIDQYTQGCIVERDELLPGDLVFFRNTYRGGISHVGIYLGDDSFIHASRQGVAVTSLSEPYWTKRFAGARRVVPDLLSEVDDPPSLGYRDPPAPE